MDWLASHPLLGLIVAAVAFVVLLVGGSWVRQMERADTDRERPRRHDEEERSFRGRPPRPSEGLLTHQQTRGPVPPAPAPAPAATAPAPGRDARRRRRKGKGKA